MGEKAYGERVVQMERMTPLQTANTPEEIAETAVWLVEGGDCVTGEIILADSGLHLVSAPLSSR
jgi:enoyl-[acyl-carrier-protein] reductase (NADH)